MKYLLPLILIGIAVGIYFGLIAPLNQDISARRVEIQDFNIALEKSKELQSVRDGLLSRYNEFTISNVERLEKMVPNNIDNVRLILDISNIASRYNMSLKDTRVQTNERALNRPLGPDERAYNSINLSFSVAGSYGAFLSLLRDLEQSLRLVDIAALSFTSSEVDFYEYNISLQTYWLKE